jgi:hypothetical protein
VFVDDFINGLKQGDETKIASAVGGIIENVHTVRREECYHGIFIGLFSLLDDRYVFKTEQPAGGGEADFIIKTKYDKSAAYIIEIKVSRKGKVVAEGAGIAQIKSRNYIIDTIREGYAEENIKLVEIILEGNKVKHIGIKKASE